MGTLDESFADVVPSAHLIKHNEQPSRIFIKSFGKFWGLAGLRVGFVIGAGTARANLRERLEPWLVGGAVIRTVTKALSDNDWPEVPVPDLNLIQID